jgi:hypothetical protein
MFLTHFSSAEVSAEQLRNCCLLPGDRLQCSRAVPQPEVTAGRQPPLRLRERRSRRGSANAINYLQHRQPCRLILDLAESLQQA